ncbi:hypothetical protein ABW19_dt0202577 [Dactylella cylindrospora]|nr:hypothetical protein ABW19_dt0202577 [Dactylella cylindrospora]
MSKKENRQPLTREACERILADAEHIRRLTGVDGTLPVLAAAAAFLTEANKSSIQGSSSTKQPTSRVTITAAHRVLAIPELLGQIFFHVGFSGSPYDTSLDRYGPNLEPDISMGDFEYDEEMDNYTDEDDEVDSDYFHSLVPHFDGQMESPKRPTYPKYAYNPYGEYEWDEKDFDIPKDSYTNAFTSLLKCRRVCRVWRDVIDHDPALKLPTWRVPTLLTPAENSKIGKDRREIRICLAFITWLNTTIRRYVHTYELNPDFLHLFFTQPATEEVIIDFCSNKSRFSKLPHFSKIWSYLGKKEDETGAFDKKGDIYRFLVINPEGVTMRDVTTAVSEIWEDWFPDQSLACTTPRLPSYFKIYGLRIGVASSKWSDEDRKAYMEYKGANSGEGAPGDPGQLGTGAGGTMNEGEPDDEGPDDEETEYDEEDHEGDEGYSIDDEEEGEYDGDTPYQVQRPPPSPPAPPLSPYPGDAAYQRAKQRREAKQQEREREERLREQRFLSYDLMENVVFAEFLGMKTFRCWY